MSQLKSMKKIIYILIALFNLALLGQTRDSLPKLTDEYLLIKEGDSVHVELEEITLLPKHKFKSRTDARYYYWFRKKVFKAYPFALIASKKLDSLNSDLENIKSKRKKKKHVKKVQKNDEDIFSDQLKKMSKTEGRILIKLIHRQTGRTVFENIKDLRSGWRAFWYNSTANVFNLNLKNEYTPGTSNEDYLIEDVLQRAYTQETLEFQESKLDTDFIKILEDKKGEVDVEVYKKMFAKRRKKNKKKEDKKK